MYRARKIYIAAILGALGGVVAATIHRYLFVDVLSSEMEPRERLIRTALLGLSVGAAIGFFPSFAEGMSRYRLGRAMRSGLLGALLGALAGLLLGPLELLYRASEGGMLYRGIALGVLGLALGATESLTGRTRWWRGLLGGALGGVVAGVVIELLPAVRNNVLETNAAVWVLVIIGFFIALFVSLLVNLLTDCWLEGISGTKVMGHVYQLSGLRHPRFGTLGSGKDCFIWIFNARPAQATISVTSAGTRLKNLGEPGEVRLNGRELNDEVTLKNGHLIDIAGVTLRYQERKRAGHAVAGAVIHGGSSGGTQRDPGIAAAASEGKRVLTPQKSTADGPATPARVVPKPRITVREEPRDALPPRIRIRENTSPAEHHARIRLRDTDRPEGDPL